MTHTTPTGILTPDQRKIAEIVANARDIEYLAIVSGDKEAEAGYQFMLQGISEMLGSVYGEQVADRVWFEADRLMKTEGSR